jgi:Sel1 repeat
MCAVRMRLISNKTLDALDLLRFPAFLLCALLTVVIARMPNSRPQPVIRAHQSGSTNVTMRVASADPKGRDAKPYAVPPGDPRTPAALAGSFGAQVQLGVAYARGQGVQPDYSVASTWLILARANGDPHAETLLRELTPKLKESEIGRVRWNLGEMYANGFGVPADKVSAYMWHCLAEAAGEERSKNAINSLSSDMTTREISDAKARTALWLRRHEESTLVPCLGTRASVAAAGRVHIQDRQE